MTYHFRVHHDGGLWAECIELPGCRTQGKTMGELRANMAEALNLYLGEPPSSAHLFPSPRNRRAGPDVVPVGVDPGVAFALQLRQARLRRGFTQNQAARRLGMRNLYSYQRLERRANPSLQTLAKVKRVFPNLSIDDAIGIA